jgi:hypothetical protein
MLMRLPESIKCGLTSEMVSSLTQTFEEKFTTTVVKLYDYNVNSTFFLPVLPQFPLCGITMIYRQWLGHCHLKPGVITQFYFVPQARGQALPFFGIALNLPIKIEL